MLLTHCVCVRGAGPGVQAARGSRGSPGSRSGGKPAGRPRVHLLAADSRWAQRGAGDRAEPGPSPPQPGAPHRPARADPGLRAVRTGGLAPNWAEQSVVPKDFGGGARDEHFPPLLSAQVARVGARALLVEFSSAGRRALPLLPGPPPEAPGKEGLFLPWGTRVTHISGWHWLCRWLV